MLHTRSNYLFYVITFFLFVLTTSCFSYIYWNPTLGGQILRCFDLIFIFLYCIHTLCERRLKTKHNSHP